MCVCVKENTRSKEREKEKETFEDELLYLNRSKVVR